MSLTREIPVTMLFANGRTSWFIFEADGVKRVDSLTALLRSDASYEKVELTGGRWVTMNGAHCYIRNGRIVRGPEAILNQKYANPQGANIFVKQMWTSYECMLEHKKHEADYGTARDYRERALELLQKSCGDNIKGYVRGDLQTIIRYDIETNDYAIGKIGKDGGIVTLFKPTDKKAYFERVKRRDLKKGGKEI